MQKQTNKESVRKYREKIKADPEKYEQKKAKQREFNRNYIEKLKKDPEKYQKYLEKEKERSRRKREKIKKNPEKKQKYNNYQKNYANKNKEKIKNYPSRSSETWKKRNLARRYNLSLEEYEEIVSLQKQKCLLCEIETEKLAVDHCHQTGKVRGLLCHNCNTSICLLKEDIKTLFKIIEYLQKHKEK